MTYSQKVELKNSNDKFLSINRIKECFEWHKHKSQFTDPEVLAKITETAVITNVDGTLNEASRQLAMAIADKVEIDYVTELGTTKLSASVNPNASGILDAIEVFNSEDEDDYVLHVNPKDYNKLVKSLFSVGGNVQDRAISTGDVAQIVGVSDIVKTKRIPEGTAFIQRKGAMEIVNKKCLLHTLISIF